MDNSTKLILVTGASTGIGRAISEYLANQGYQVYAGARKEKDLQRLTQIDNITAIKLDVTSDDDVQSAVKQVENSGLSFFGLVNNAGIAVAGPLMDIPIEEMEKQFAVNLFGVHRVTQAFLPFLLKSQGRIIMMSSDSGFFATPIFGPYCASKFALEGYSDSLRRELLLFDVKVIILQPGRITTPIWDKGQKLLNKYPDSLFKEINQQLGAYAIRKGKTAGLPPIDVAKVVYSALTVQKPKLRYLIAPNPSKYRLIKILPPWKVDKMLEKELRKFSHPI